MYDPNIVEETLATETDAVDQLVENQLLEVSGLFKTLQEVDQNHPSVVQLLGYVGSSSWSQFCQENKEIITEHFFGELPTEEIINDNTLERLLQDVANKFPSVKDVRENDITVQTLLAYADLGSWIEFKKAYGELITSLFIPEKVVLTENANSARNVRLRVARKRYETIGEECKKAAEAVATMKVSQTKMRNALVEAKNLVMANQFNTWDMDAVAIHQKATQQAAIIESQLPALEKQLILLTNRHNELLKQGRIADAKITALEAESPKIVLNINNPAIAIDILISTAYACGSQISFWQTRHDELVERMGMHYNPVESTIDGVFEPEPDRLMDIKDTLQEWYVVYASCEIEWEIWADMLDPEKRERARKLPNLHEVIRQKQFNQATRDLQKAKQNVERMTINRATGQT